MQNRRFTQDNPEKVASLQPKNSIQWLKQLFKNKKQLGVVTIGAAFFVVLLIAISLTLGTRPARSESYIDVSGAAGLSATIAQVIATITTISMSIFLLPKVAKLVQYRQTQTVR